MRMFLYSLIACHSWAAAAASQRHELRGASKALAHANIRLRRQNAQKHMASSAVLATGVLAGEDHLPVAISLTILEEAPHRLVLRLELVCGLHSFEEGVHLAVKLQNHLLFVLLTAACVAALVLD